MNDENNRINAMRERGESLVTLSFIDNWRIFKSMSCREEQKWFSNAISSALPHDEESILYPLIHPSRSNLKPMAAKLNARAFAFLLTRKRQWDYPVLHGNDQRRRPRATTMPSTSSIYVNGMRSRATTDTRWLFLQDASIDSNQLCIDMRVVTFCNSVRMPLE